jgi:hypothetical protein
MSIRYRCFNLLALVCAALGLAFGSAEEAGAASAEYASQPKFYVAGCEITLDLSRTHDCLERAVDRERREAERHGKALIQKQVDSIQSQLDGAQRQLADANKELERAQKNLEREVAKAVARERLALAKAAKAGENLLMTDWGKEISRTVATHAPLFACLEKEPGFDFVAMSNAFAADPGAFAESQIRTSIAGVRRQWATVMKAEMAQIASGRIPPTPTAAFAASADKLARLAEPVPGARCVFTHVTPMVQPHIAQVVRDAAPVIEKELRAILNEQILPEVQKGVTAQLREIFRQVTVPKPPSGVESQLPFLKGLVLTDEEFRGIVRDVLLDRRFAQLKQLLPAVEAVNKVAVSARSTDAMLLEARKRVLAVLEPTPDWDRLYLQIGVEALRKVGHKYLDSEEPGHGGYLLNNGISLLQFGEGTYEKIVEAICGLIPEVGGAICAVIEEGINFAWNQGAVPGIEAVASSLLHNAWNQAMDRVRKQVDSGRPIAEIAGKTGLVHVDALIGTVPHETVLEAWATGAASSDRDRLDAVFNAVGTLATAATTR